MATERALALNRGLRKAETLNIHVRLAVVSIERRTELHVRLVVDSIERRTELHVRLVVDSIERSLDVMIHLSDTDKLGLICWIVFRFARTHTASALPAATCQLLPRYGQLTAAGSKHCDTKGSA